MLLHHPVCQGQATEAKSCSCTLCITYAGNAQLPVHASCVQVSLMDADGNTKDDLKLPGGTDEAEKLADTIQAEFSAGKELTVVVLKAMGEFYLRVGSRLSSSAARCLLVHRACCSWQFTCHMHFLSSAADVFAFDMFAVACSAGDEAISQLKQATGGD